PDQGRARLGGIDVVGDPQGARRRFAATGQETTLDDLLTGRENLIMLGRLLGLGRASSLRADELLEQFDLALAGRRTVSTYSGGMRRRLDLAATLISQPEVLFLDEPTTGLDPVSRRRVWDDVRELAGSGSTVFLTTQTLDEAEALADRIAVLRDGRIVADGTAEELTASIGGHRLVLPAREGRQVRATAHDRSGRAALAPTWLLIPRHARRQCPAVFCGVHRPEPATQPPRWRRAHHGHRPARVPAADVHLCLRRRDHLRGLRGLRRPRGHPHLRG